MNFDYGVQDTSGKNIYTSFDASEDGLKTSSNIQNNNDYLCLNGKEDITLNKFNSYEMGEYMYLELRFKTEQRIHRRPSPIFTNCVRFKDKKTNDWVNIAPSVGIVINANANATEDLSSLSVFVNTTDTGTRMNILPIKVAF